MSNTPARQTGSGHSHQQGQPVDNELAQLIQRLRAGDRGAAAEFVTTNEQYIRRRVRGKLGSAMRRVCDSQDVFSTVARRLDRLVLNRHLTASDVQQLWSLIHRITDAALIDKLHDHLSQPIAERDDCRCSPFDVPGAESGSERTSEDERWMEQLFAAAGGDVDRQILAWWLADIPLFRIAQHLEMTPGAVRARWSDIRRRIRLALSSSEDTK